MACATKNGLTLLVFCALAACLVCVVWSPEAMAASKDDEFVIDALVYNRLYLALDRVNRIYGLYELQALPIPKLSEMITLDDYRRIKNTHVDKALFEDAYFAVAKIAKTYNVGPSMAVANIFSEIPRVYTMKLARKSREGTRKWFLNPLLLSACILVVAFIAIFEIIKRRINTRKIIGQLIEGNAPDSESIHVAKTRTNLVRNVWRGLTQAQRIKAISAVVFIFLGWPLVREAVGDPALSWMFVYHLSDFTSAENILPYLKGLRTGIPPLLSLLEISAYLFFGSTALVTEIGYQCSMLLMFLIPPLAFARGLRMFFASLGLSFVFLWSTTIIAVQNPIIYDVYFPFLVILYMVCLKSASSPGHRSSIRFILCLLAGSTIAFAELSRPFMLLIVPFLLVGAYVALRGHPKRFFITFLVPVILISGGWHAKLFILQQGQILWSNHGGQEIYKSWKHMLEEDAKFIDRSHPEYRQLREVEFPGSGARHYAVPYPTTDLMNSELTYRNSKIGSRMVREYFLSHPGEALRLIIARVADLVEPQVQVFRNFGVPPPSNGILRVYSAGVRIAMILLLVNSIALVYFVVRGRMWILGEPESWITFFSCSTIFLLAIGSYAEAARFLIVVLPFIAVLPTLFLVRRPEQVTYLDPSFSPAVQHVETRPRISTAETSVAAAPLSPASPEITLMAQRLRTVAIFGFGVVATVAAVGVWTRFYSGEKAAETIRIGPPRIVSTEFAEGEEPNVIIILADDLGYTDLSCYGAKGISTPNCDRLAAAGRKFLNAHSPAAVCSPTRYGLLTGQYAWRTALPVGVLGPLAPLLINPERYTLADLFKENGYATGCVGKWHLGFGDTQYTNWNEPLRPGPLEVGFDSYFGVPVSSNLPPRVYVEDDHVVGRKAGEEIVLIQNLGGHYYQQAPISGERVQERIGLRHTEKAVRFIEENADHRFFLYFPTAAIHEPLVSAPAFKGSSKIGAYGDYVQQFDWTVGRILETLDKHGLADNTLVILTSDNGGFRIYSPKSHDPNASLRGQKGEVYEGGHRVPFIAKWPGHIAPGSTSDALISLTDFLATFAALFGKSLPENAGEDSINVLLELLGRPHTKPLRNTAIYQAASGTLAIQAGPWKLIPARHGGGFGTMFYAPDESDPVYSSSPEGQLYNLRKDLAETKNLYDLRPKVAARLAALLERYKEQGHSRPQPES